MPASAGPECSLTLRQADEGEDWFDAIAAVGVLEPLLPAPAQTPLPLPRPQAPDHRKVLTGILFVLKTGIAWDDLPAELGCGCGKTCRHYLRLWHQAGVWRQLHALLLAELNGADQIDWERALIDASFAKAPEGGRGHRPEPHGSRQIGQQASRADRRPGHPAGRDGDGGQRQRGHAGLPGADRHARRRRQAGPQAAEAGAPARGPGLRLRAGAAGCCAGWGSRPSWRRGIRSTAAAWGCSAGSWSGPSPGCMRSGGCGVAWIGSPRFKRRSSVWRCALICLRFLDP